jgi:hypothetical protein
MKRVADSQLFDPNNTPNSDALSASSLEGDESSLADQSESEKEEPQSALEKWKAIIEDWEKSGLSQYAYSCQNNINPGSLYDWAARFRDPQYYEKACARAETLQDHVCKKWKEIIDDWKQSGSTISTYCNKHELPHTSFRNWLYRFYPSYRSRRKSPVISTKNKKPTRVRTRDQWKAIVEDWKKSRLPKAEYCREYGLSGSSLSLWTQRLFGVEFYQQVMVQAHEEWLKSRFYTFEQWEDVIKDWQKSGMDIPKYCEKHKLVENIFRRWVQKITGDELPSQSTEDLKSTDSSQDHKPEPKSSKTASSLKDLFIPVTIKPDSTDASSSETSPKVEVTLSQGHKLTIQGPFEWEKVMAVLMPLLREG